MSEIVNLKQARLNKETSEIISRHSKFKQRYDLLNDNFKYLAIAKLKKVYSSVSETGIDKQIDITNNVFKSVINAISRVYTFGVERETENEELATYIKNSNINKLLKQANIYTNALNDVLLQVSWNEAKQVPRFIFRLPHQTEVTLNEFDEIETVMYFHSHLEDSSQKWVFWSKEEHYNIIIDKNGKEKKEYIRGNEKGINPLKILPFVSFKNGFRDNGEFWDLYRGDDLVEITLDNSLYSTFKNYMIKWQSFKQAVLTGTNIGSIDGQMLDPSAPLVIEGQDASFSILDLQANIKELTEVISNSVSNVAINYNISPSQFRMSGNISSGFALKMENQKLDEFTREQQTDFIQYEKELFDLIVLMFNTYANKNYINDVTTNIIKPTYNESRDTILANYEKEIALGLISPIEIIEDERGIDEELAIQVYQDNIKYRNEANNRLNEASLNIETTLDKLNEANQ